MGTSEVATEAADKFRQSLSTIKQENQNKTKITSFHQVWHDPLRTLTKQSVVSQIIELCGGVNIYADATGVAPIISIESLLTLNPDTILGSQPDGYPEPWGNYWKQNWPKLQAINNNNLIDLPSDESKRPTVRILEAAEILCSKFDKIRIKVNDNNI